MYSSQGIINWIRSVLFLSYSGSNLTFQNITNAVHYCVFSFTRFQLIKKIPCHNKDVKIY